MIWILQNLYDTYSRYTKCPTCTWKENALIQCSSPCVSKSATIIVLLSVSPFISVDICFMYLGYSLLDDTETHHIVTKGSNPSKNKTLCESSNKDLKYIKQKYIKFLNI